MSGNSDYRLLGPEIRIDYSTSLQSSVAEKLLRQTESAVLVHAVTATNEDAIQALKVLVDLPETRRSRILLHPTFRYWLQTVRRTQPHEYDERDRAIRCLPEFFWAEQYLTGQLIRSWSLITDSKGGLRCPSFGRFIELGTLYANSAVEASPHKDGIVIRCGDGLTIRVPPEDLKGPIIQPPPTIEEHGYFLNVSTMLADGRIEVSNRDPWLRVKLTGTNERTTGTEFSGTDEKLYPELSSIQSIESALALLERIWPAAYEDLAVFTRVIVPISAFSGEMTNNAGSAPSASGGTYRAFTVSSRQGAIYIGPAPVEPTLEMLIHEYAHVKLRQIQALDPLLSNPLDESARFPVPWRPDPRPLPGILEGLFVFSYVAEFEWRHFEQSRLSRLRVRVTKRVGDLRHAAECLEQNAELTSKGRQFVGAMKEWVDDLANRAVR